MEMGNDVVAVKDDEMDDVFFDPESVEGDAPGDDEAHAFDEEPVGDLPEEG